MADGGGSGDGGSGVGVAVGESPIRSHNLLTILFNRLIYSRGIKKKNVKSSHDHDQSLSPFNLNVAMTKYNVMTTN